LIFYQFTYKLIRSPIHSDSFSSPLFTGSDDKSKRAVWIAGRDNSAEQERARGKHKKVFYRFDAGWLTGWLDEEEVGTKSEKKLKTNRERSLIV
jgi:hypothetical protein